MVKLRGQINSVIKNYSEMALTKKRKIATAKVDNNKAYTLREASSLVKEVNTTKFDASIDLHVRLGVDPKKADQSIRGTVSLPHGTGKTKKVLVLCQFSDDHVFWLLLTAKDRHRALLAMAKSCRKFASTFYFFRYLANTHLPPTAT